MFKHSPCSTSVDRIPLGTAIYIDILNQKEWIYKVYRGVLYVSAIALIGVCLCIELIQDVRQVKYEDSKHRTGDRSLKHPHVTDRNTA